MVPRFHYQLPVGFDELGKKSFLPPLFLEYLRDFLFRCCSTVPCTWPWVGESVGFIIVFVCFPTQQNMVNRKHPISCHWPSYLVCSLACYIPAIHVYICDNDAIDVVPSLLIFLDVPTETNGGGLFGRAYRWRRR